VRRHLVLTALLLAAVMLVSACSRAQTGTGNTQPEVKKGPGGEVYGGTYRIAIAAEPPGIDPQVDTTLQVYNLSRAIFNTLIRYKGDTLELEPELLAEMPKVEGDRCYGPHCLSQ
jgi:ABC-type transport system substrate-binding protein